MKKFKFLPDKIPHKTVEELEARSPKPRPSTDQEILTWAADDLKPYYHISFDIILGAMARKILETQGESCNTRCPRCGEN